jgi:AcrR family transcriptional regulator
MIGLAVGYVIGCEISIFVRQMYRIKKDKRTESSAAKICNGLVVCMRDKKFSSIGVAEIAAASGVSRATFYRIFDTPYDVLVYICDSLAEDLADSISLKTIKDKDEISLNALIYLTEHADEISVVFKSGRTDLMQQALEPYSERIAPGIERMFSRKELDYARISIAALLVGILSVWESRGRKDSPRELLAIFKKFSIAANKSIPSVLSKE